MDKKQKQKILETATIFFQNEIIPRHLENLKKLTKLSKFKYNPFLLTYLARFLTGKDDPESIATILVYPRVLGTSINTTFGNQSQKFCSTILKGLGSTTKGIDIEFTDQIDGRKKYCQIKAGPETINNDDIKTISSHFENVKRLAKTNNTTVAYGDLIIGILYGKPINLSGNYRVLAREYPVYIGKEFWHRLTGDSGFYIDLINAFGKATQKVNTKQVIEGVIKQLSEDIKSNLAKENV